MSVQIFDLSHTFEPFMPQWPSGCNLKEEVIRYHADADMYNIQWEGIMHRGTHMDAPLHVTELTPEAVDEFKAASASCYDEFADKLTPELIAAFTK